MIVRALELLDGELGGHPSPAVTVTAKLTVETTVVVAQEVTVPPEQCEHIADEGSEALAVPDVLVLAPDVDERDIDEVVELEPLEDVVEAEEGRPHSSRLWPFGGLS